MITRCIIWIPVFVMTAVSTTCKDTMAAYETASLTVFYYCWTNNQWQPVLIFSVNTIWETLMKAPLLQDIWINREKQLFIIHYFRVNYVRVKSSLYVFIYTNTTFNTADIQPYAPCAHTHIHLPGLLQSVPKRGKSTIIVNSNSSTTQCVLWAKNDKNKKSDTENIHKHT